MSQGFEPFRTPKGDGVIEVYKTNSPKVWICSAQLHYETVHPRSGEPRVDNLMVQVACVRIQRTAWSVYSYGPDGTSTKRDTTAHCSGLPSLTAAQHVAIELLKAHITAIAISGKYELCGKPARQPPWGG